MKKSIIIAAAWFFFWYLVSMCFTSPVYAEKIPALSEIPAGLSLDINTRLAQQKQALEKDLADFQAAAAKFNAKDAKDQSDSEYEALTAWRTRYINAAKAFNREMAEAQQTEQQPLKITPYIVQLDSVRGEFSIENSDGSRFTNANIRAGQIAQIDSGTRVITGPMGHLQIVLPDETTFTIGPDSEIIMDDFVYDKDMTANKIFASVIKGVFRWVTGKVARKDRANMVEKTRIFYIGIRGTDFETFVDLDGSGYIKLFSGMLEIKPLKGDAVIIMKEHNMLTFKADGTFSKPESIK